MVIWCVEMKCVDLLTPTETACQCRQYREMGKVKGRKLTPISQPTLFITFQKMEIAKKGAYVPQVGLYFRASLRLIILKAG